MLALCLAASSEAARYRAAELRRRLMKWPTPEDTRCKILGSEVDETWRWKAPKRVIRELEASTNREERRAVVFVQCKHGVFRTSYARPTR